MANVTDSLSYNESYQPFEKPPDSSALYSLIPRGIRRFWIAEAISAKPINDDYQLFVTATLPVNFAYILRSLNWQISSDVAAAFLSTVVVRMSNHIPGQPLGTVEIIHSKSSVMNDANNETTLALQEPVHLNQFAGPMWSVHGGSMTMRVEQANTADPAGAAGFITSHAEFYEYDLSQAQRYYVNTPVPVLTR